MKGLTDTDNAILGVLKDYPQGLFLHQIQKYVGIKKKQYAYYYMQKLIRKVQVVKREQLYFLAPGAHVGGTKHITIPITSSSKKKNQRPHALQYNARLYRTSADRAGEYLKALNIPFKQPVPRQFSITWKGLKLKLTSRKLIAYPHTEEAPLNVPGENLRVAIAVKMAQTIEDFLKHTGLKCMRTKTGELLLECRNWEVGFPKNEVDQKVYDETQQEYIIYAIDRQTGKAKIWGDGSPDPFRELETNSTLAEPLIKEFMQGIEDGEIRPYEDELKTRDALIKLKKVVIKHDREIQNYGEGFTHVNKIVEHFDKKFSTHEELIKLLLNRQVPAEGKPTIKRAE